MASTYIDPVQNRYDTSSHGFRGLCVIINNETFQDPDLKFRNGSTKDVDSVKATFGRLGFQFQEHKDQTSVEMLKIMMKVTQSTLDGFDCLVVVILSHGAADGKIHGTGPRPSPKEHDSISLDKLLCPLKSIQNQKPKLIFVQACRGEDFDEGRRVAADDDGSDSKIENYIKVPMEADFLYHFSSSPGYFSFRNSNGSIFIQNLCAVTQQHIDAFEEIDFLKVLTRVNRRIADGYKSNAPFDPAFHEKKQMPSIVSMLRKDLYFLRKA